MMTSGTTDRADAMFERGIHPTPLRDAPAPPPSLPITRHEIDLTGFP
jgi:hypothetical protein